eukprot:3692318-Rhodomonas_salina.3
MISRAKACNRSCIVDFVRGREARTGYVPKLLQHSDTPLAQTREIRNGESVSMTQQTGNLTLIGIRDARKWCMMDSDLQISMLGHQTINCGS